MENGPIHIQLLVADSHMRFQGTELGRASRNSGSSSAIVLLGDSVSLTTLHQSVQPFGSLKYKIVAQASIQDRSTQLSILQHSLLMWQGARQAGTFGMMQLALPEGHKRKTEAEIRLLSLWQLPGSSTMLTGGEGKKGRGENKTQKAQSGNC